MTAMSAFHDVANGTYGLANGGCGLGFSNFWGKSFFNILFHENIYK